MDSESQELVDELTYSWLEMHKKSALNYLVLAALSEKGLWTKDLETQINELTGWMVHERALYRLLQRLEKQGMIAFETQAAKRTGAERKIYQLTSEGEALLSQIEGELRYLRRVVSESN